MMATKNTDQGHCPLCRSLLQTTAADPRVYACRSEGCYNAAKNTGDDAPVPPVLSAEESAALSAVLHHLTAGGYDHPVPEMEAPVRVLEQALQRLKGG